MILLALTASVARSWYTGFNIGGSVRYLDIKFNQATFSDKIGRPFYLDPEVHFGQLIKKIGLGDTVYGTFYLGYKWKINKFWLGVETFISVEPYNLEFKLPTVAARREGEEPFTLKMSNIVVGGMIGKFGYYITPSVAIVLVTGIEAGLQGGIVFKNPIPGFSEKKKSIPDGGIRLGLEMRTDLTDSWSMNLGFHQTFLPSSLILTWAPKYKKNLDEYAIDHISFKKIRCYVGFQYFFKKR